MKHENSLFKAKTQTGEFGTNDDDRWDAENGCSYIARVESNLSRLIVKQK